MITTGVKGADAGMMNLPVSAPAKPQSQKENDSFQKVFDKQTNRGKGQVEQTDKRGQERGEHVKKHTSSQADRIRGPKAETAPEEKQLDEEELLAVNEAAVSAAQEILAQLSEVFQVPQEEIQDIMQELGLEVQDLLSEPELKQLAMVVGDVQDPMELVTDGELLGKVQELLSTRQEVVSQASGEFSMEPREFLQAAQRVQIPGEETLELQPREELPKAEQGEEPSIRPDMPQHISETPVVQDPHQSEQGQGKENSRQQHESAPHENSHLVMQQTVQNVEEPAMNPMVENAGEGERVDTEMIMRQIMDHMKVQLKPDVSSLEMQLHPASLGNLQVQLTSRGGAVTAQFFAQNETVKAALETQMIQLQQSFDEQGIKVDAIEVSVQTQQFEENLEEQGRQRQEQQTARSRGTRRIRIDESLTPEQLDELTQDERIATEMLQAGGGTVDFTA